MSQARRKDDLPPVDPRAQRAARARRAGNDRKIADAVVVLPDTAERQAGAALARLRAAEAARPNVIPIRSTPELPQFDLAGAVRHLRPEYVVCRDWGHSWAPQGSFLDGKHRQWESSAICRSCTSVRTRRVSSVTGERLDSDIEYADGYLMAGAGRLNTEDRNMIRLASMRQGH